MRLQVIDGGDLGFGGSGRLVFLPSPPKSIVFRLFKGMAGAGSATLLLLHHGR